MKSKPFILPLSLSVHYLSDLFLRATNRTHPALSPALALALPENENKKPQFFEYKALQLTQLQLRAGDLTLL